MNIKKIHICALGGTIGSVANSSADEYYDSASINIESLISSLPINNKEITLRSEQLFQKKSQDISHDDLLVTANKIHELVQDDEVNGVVVTQGTNSIEEVAYFINLVINTQKPIVFTGSFRPNNSMDHDGSKNLYNAILLAASNKAIGQGVLLTFNDSIVHAREASKINPSIMSDFSNSNLGVLGYIQGSNIHMHHQTLYKHTYLSAFNIVDIQKLPSVCIIYGHFGMSSIFVNAALKSNLKGIVSAGMGKGYQTIEVTESLVEASKQGVIIVRCSRSGQGIVHRDPKLDDKFGMVAGGSLNPQKAVILLALALTKTDDKLEIQRFFDEY